MYCAQVGVLEKSDEVGLCRLMQRKNRVGLETNVFLEILRNLSHQTLKGFFADEQFRGLLVTANFTKSNRPRAVAMGFLDAAGSRGFFAVFNFSIR